MLRVMNDGAGVPGEWRITVGVGGGGSEGGSSGSGAQSATPIIRFSDLAPAWPLPRHTRHRRDPLYLEDQPRSAGGGGCEPIYPEPG